MRRKRVKPMCRVLRLSPGLLSGKGRREVVGLLVDSPESLPAPAGSLAPAIMRYCGCNHGINHIAPLLHKVVFYT